MSFHTPMFSDGYSAYHWMKKAQAVVGGITDFTDLADTPANYTGTSGRYLRVNGTGNGIEFDTLTKEDISLDNVDNTSDLGKPISTATQAALDTKTNTSTTTALDTRVTTIEGDIAGITNEAVSGSYPLRIQIDKPLFISDGFTLRTYSNLEDRELVHNLAMKNAIAAETIGTY